MKKLIIALGLVLLCAPVFAQATKSITRDSLNFREKYSVLKSNPAVKEGDYTLKDVYSGKILTTGFYKNNQRDSVWRDYDRNDHVIVEGKYKNGQKTGEWNYYGKLWAVVTKYNFSTNQLLFHQYTKADSTKLFQVLRGKDSISTQMDQPPFYRSGDEIMYRKMAMSLRYPPVARQKGVTGRVIVCFTVDEHGNTRDYKTAYHLGYGLDEEAIRVIKLLAGDWVPGSLNGKPVPVVVRMPVAFNLAGK